MAHRASRRSLVVLALVLGLQLGAHAPRALAASNFETERIDALIAHHAYQAARDELKSQLESTLGEDHNRTRYLLGYVERRLGHPSEARDALARVSSQSLWYVRSQQELANELRAEGEDDQADALLYRLIGILSGASRDRLRLELADGLFLRGRYNPALDGYRDVLEGDGSGPSKEHAAFAIAWCYQRLGNPARAIWSWKEAVRRFPRSPQVKSARLMLANQYLLIGKPLLASDELHVLARSTLDPELAARAQFLAGEGYASVGNWKLARASYAMVKPGTRWSEPAEYAEAYARWQSGDATHAKPALELWLSKYPKSPARPAVLYALGRIDLELGAPEKARAIFMQAIRDPAPNSYAELALFGLAELDYNDTRYQACADMARALLKTYPKAAERGPARWLLAESLLALKQYPAAIEVYRELAQNEPDLGFLEGKGDAVTFRLGLALFRAGDYPAAASYLKEVSEGHYGAEALFWLAEAAYRTGDFEGALANYERLLKLHPGTEHAAEAAYGEAYSAYQLKRYDFARERFKQAADTLHNDALREDAQLRLASLQLDEHAWSAAKATYESLYTSQLSADHVPDVLFGLAWSSLRNGEDATAANLAETFVARFAANPRVDRARAIEGQAYFRLGKYPEAVKSFEAILGDSTATSFERSDAQARIGAAYFNAGKFDQAITAYQTLYADPNRPKSERDGIAQPLVQAKIAVGDLDGALKLASQEASGSIWAGDALARIAEGYLKAHRASDAITALNTIDNPTLAERHLLSNAYLAANNPEASLATLDPIAHIPGPDQIAWTAELAERYLNAGDLDRAKRTYADLRRLQPTHPALLKGAIAIANAYAKAGRDQLALDAYKELAERFKAKPEVAMVANLRIGQLELKRANYSAAAIAYRQAEKDSPAGSLSAVEARYWLGFTLVAARRYEDAASELSKLKVTNAAGREWQALAWLKAGEAYEHMRRWKDASKLYRLIQHTPQMPASERAEASDRLQWIDQNINRRQP